MSDIWGAPLALPHRCLRVMAPTRPRLDIGPPPRVPLGSRRALGCPQDPGPRPNVKRNTGACLVVAFLPIRDAVGMVRAPQKGSVTPASVDEPPAHSSQPVQALGRLHAPG